MTTRRSFLAALAAVGIVPAQKILDLPDEQIPDPRRIPSDLVPYEPTIGPDRVAPDHVAYVSFDGAARLPLYELAVTRNPPPSWPRPGTAAHDEMPLAMRRIGWESATLDWLDAAERDLFFTGRPVEIVVYHGDTQYHMQGAAVEFSKPLGECYPCRVQCCFTLLRPITTSVPA